MTRDQLDELEKLAERFAQDDAREDLDAEEWGSAIPPWTVLALLQRVRRLEALGVTRDERHCIRNCAEEARLQRPDDYRVVAKYLARAISALTDSGTGEP